MYEAEQLRQLQLIERAITSSFKSLGEVLGEIKKSIDNLSKQSSEDNNELIKNLEGILEQLKESNEIQNKLLENVDSNTKAIEKIPPEITNIKTEIQNILKKLDTVDKHQMSAAVWSGIIDRYYDKDDKRNDIRSIVNGVINTLNT